MENQFSQPNQTLCENSSRSFWQSLSLRALFTLVRNSRLNPLIARVNRDSRAILLAGVQAAANRRLYVGVWFITVFSPLASVSYHWFDRQPYNAQDYYGNAFYFLFSLSPNISLLLSITGVFFLFPEFSKRKFFLLIPASYHLAKIVWLAQVTSNEEFHRILPMSFFLLGFSISFVWFFTFEWLMSLHFHKREGIIARIIGVIKAPDISLEDKVRIANSQIDQLKDLK